MANHGDARHGNNKAESETPNQGRIATAASPLHHHGGTSNSEIPRRVSRKSMGSDRSIDHSPLHPHHQPSKVGKSSGGFSSPSWDRKNSSEGNHGLDSTPGRSRLKPVTKGNDTPDDTPAVPKFGDWDDNDPKSAEEFTQIFQIVRDERHSGAGKVPHSSSDGSYPNGHKQYGKKNPKICGCFSWCRK